MAPLHALHTLPVVRARPRVGTLVYLNEDGSAIVYLDPTVGAGQVQISGVGLAPEQAALLNDVLARVMEPKTTAQALAVAVLMSDEQEAAMFLADYLQENGFTD